MKTGTLLAALLVAGACIAGIVWVAGGVNDVVISDPEKREDPDGLPISDTGPWPKAVVEEDLHNFGTMAVGTTKSHTFKVKNESPDTPLKLKLGATSCSCTLGELDKDSIAPGETGDVTLEWQPTGVSEDFDKTATIYTNDPQNPILIFHVVGKVEDLIQVQPMIGLDYGNVDREQSVTRSVIVYSGVLDEFKITSAVAEESDKFNISIEPLDDDSKAALDTKTGYRVNVELKTEKLLQGEIKERVTIKTNVPEAGSISVALKANYEGPIKGLPYHPNGYDSSISYNTDILYIGLGDVESQKGKKAYYKLAVGEMPEGTEFEVADVTSTLDGVTATLEKIEAPIGGNKKYYVVEFDVKPGIPTGSYTRKNSAKVVLKTNHPDAPEVKFYVEFIAI